MVEALMLKQGDIIVFEAREALQGSLKAHFKTIL